MEVGYRMYLTQLPAIENGNNGNKTSVLIRCNSNIQDFMYSLFNHLTVENSYSLTCTLYMQCTRQHTTCT